MISVENALKQVELNSVYSERVILKSPENALGFVLAQSVLSPINMPPFQQSAMDGYAVNGMDMEHFTLIGEIQAGGSQEYVLAPGEAVRIFTGAPVPETAEAVIMQEQISLSNDNKSIEIHASLTPNQNIRPKGEQIEIGEIALEKGCKINGAIVGYLSGLGITEISVFDKPRISIIATGNELIQPGNSLNYGEIYESNAVMLKSVCLENGFPVQTIKHVIDDFSSTKNAIKSSISTSDFVLITGGISVGDYDFVGKALKELGVKEHFYKVKQKPGKPLFFGTSGNTNIFALPGNPAAALTGFYIYILNALSRFSRDQKIIQSKIGRLQEPFVKKGNRAQFLKAHLNSKNELKILTGQSSAMLRAFSMANAFVYIPEDKEKVESGENVTFYPISHV